MCETHAIMRPPSEVDGVGSGCPRDCPPICRNRQQEGLAALSLDQIIVAMFVIAGAAFVAVALGASWLLSPKKPTPEKAETYECGVEPIGNVWVQFRPGYYVYALLYVFFDIETVFLYPFAVTFGLQGWFIFVEMVIFLGILVAGLVYAWKEGALTWR